MDTIDILTHLTLDAQTRGLRYVRSGDREPAHYEPASGSNFAPGQVPEARICPACGQPVEVIYRWQAADGTDCYRTYPQICDCVR